MSNQEITRLEAMQRIKDKRLTRKEAARILYLSVRQIQRLYRAYQAQGVIGLVTRQAEIVETKTLDHQIKTPTPPVPNHPLRRNGLSFSICPTRSYGYFRTLCTSPQSSRPERLLRTSP